LIGSVFINENDLANYEFIKVSFEKKESPEILKLMVDLEHYKYELSEYQDNLQIATEGIKETEKQIKICESAIENMIKMEKENGIYRGGNE